MSHSLLPYRRSLLFGTILVLLCLDRQAWSHEQSRASFEASRRVALAKAKAQAEATSEQSTKQPTAQLKLQLKNEAGKPIAGLVKITNITTGKAIELEEAIHREMNWYSLPAKSTLTVPRTKLRIEALHGIQSELVTREIDLAGKNQGELELRLPFFYDPRSRNEIGGNTHLHLMKLSYDGAIDYLETVPRSDGLDLVFLSHLRRASDEHAYISNLIVEQDLEHGKLRRLSGEGVLFANGEEHRHNFDAHDEGYGHVMLLNLKKLIRPVSIGPGIMGEGTDGIPVQRGIQTAREDGATVIWCHGKYGMEDVPNWLAGLLHAQNIFDGGSKGSYEDSFYKYLNLGMRIPFSTGTDWFIYDFSRVYVPIFGEVTVKKWLEQLAAGRSYITNGTFLDLTADNYQVGDTVMLESPKTVQVHGRAVGRNDFGSLELISNGEVVHAVASQKREKHFEATMQIDFEISEPGWLALRIPRNSGKNELDKELFAHTSPIYVELEGRRIFRPAIARELIREIETNMAKIPSLGVFELGEEESVLAVHRRAVEQLTEMLQRNNVSLQD